MKGVRSEGAVAELLGRARLVRPELRPRWGSLDAPRMMCHVADAVRLALGDIPTHPRPRPWMNTFPIRDLVLYCMPWPHGVPGPREAFTTQPCALDADVKALEAALMRFLDHHPAGEWPPHPIFGPMTARDWNRLLYRHTDHHLRQFGV